MLRSDLSTTEMEKLLNKVSKLYLNHHSEELINGNLFNLFYLLEIENKELMHSKFIAYLLYTRENHGMGDAFLKSFLHKVLHKEISDKTLESKVQIEKTISTGNTNPENNGRIDILLKYDDTEIVIENKIYANDQNRQLIRYREAHPKALICYLTLNGTLPDEISIKDETTTLNSDEHFYCISYGNEMINWIEDCIQLTNGKPNIQIGIKQYLTIIQDLTNRNQMSKELVKLLTKPEHITAAVTIMNSQLTFRNAIKSKLQADVMNVCETKGLTCNFEYWHHNYSRFFVHDETLRRNDLKIAFEFNARDPLALSNFYVGLKVFDDKTELNEEDILINQNEGPDKRFVYWKYINEHPWNQEDFESIANGKYVEDVIIKHVQEALSKFDIVKSKF
jgi:hypothetical protein